ncbi:MAG: 4Fe-4S dicluster domain-containing protein [Planctomycetota bacterium]
MNHRSAPAAQHSMRPPVPDDAASFTAATTFPNAPRFPNATPHDEPRPTLSDAEIAYLRTRRPFRDLDPKAFPRAQPLDAILREQTRLLRYLPGDVIVRKGDYGQSAFLVLAGSVDLVRHHVAGSEPTAAKPAEPLTLRRLLAGYFSRVRSNAAPPSNPSPSSNAGLSGHSDTLTEYRSAEAVFPPRQGSQRLHHVDGRAAIRLQDFDAIIDAHGQARLGPGELFGEVAAMYRSPHATTVLANVESSVLEISWRGLRSLRRDPGFSEQLDQHYRHHWLQLHLRETPLLRHLDDAAIAAVAARTQLRSHGRLEWYADFRRSRKQTPAQQIESEPLVASEGAYPSELLVVRSGFGRMCVQHGSSSRTVAYLGAGHLFGIDEILQNYFAGGPQVPLQSTLRAVGMLDVLAIPVEVLVEHVLPRVRRQDLPATAQHWIPERDRRSGRKRWGGQDRRVDSKKAKRQESRVQDGDRLVSSDAMEFVVGQRLMNGRSAMVIDLHRCTRCDDCVQACATMHDGNPRFSRTGPTHHHLQFASACMHCIDPVCMIGCPTGAIHRQPDQPLVLIDEATCIGCGTCAAACPYGNIDMVAVVDASGAAHVDPESGKAMQKATKCDHCHEHGGKAACVAACPHDALVRLDLTHSRPLDAWLGLET